MNYKKDFKKWNSIKEKIHNSEIKLFFKERDIFFVHLGENIGDEEDGKGEKFLRPVIVLRKFNNNIFIGIPLTTKIKNNEFYFEFEFNGKINSVILSQMKLVDKKRIVSKIGMISKEDFQELKRKITKLLKLDN